MLTWMLFACAATPEPAVTVDVPAPTMAPAPTAEVEAPPVGSPGFDPAKGGPFVRADAVHALPGGHRLAVWWVTTDPSTAEVWLDWTPPDGERRLIGQGFAHAVDPARGRFAWQGAVGDEVRTRLVDVVAGTDVTLPAAPCTTWGALRFDGEGHLIAAAPDADAGPSPICAYDASGARLGAVAFELDWGSCAGFCLESGLSVHDGELRVADCRYPEFRCRIARVPLGEGAVRVVDVPPPELPARLEVEATRYRVVPGEGPPGAWAPLPPGR